MDPSKHHGLPPKPPTALGSAPVASVTPIPSVATQYQQPFGSQSSDQFSPPATGHGATAHGAMGQGAAGNGAIGHTSVLWVGGIPPGTPMQHLEFIFRRHNSMQIDLKPGKDQTQNWYAFIHFTKRSDAENARVALDGKQIFPGGAPLSVRWRQHGGPASHAGQPAIPLQVMPISTPTPVQPASTPSYGASMLQMPQAYPMQGHQAQTGTAPFNRPPMPHLSQPQNTQAHQAQASTSPVYGAPMPQLAQPQHMQMHHMQANQAQTGATMPQMMPQAHNMQAHQAQAGATSFHGAAIPQLPQVQPTPARQVPTGIAPYHGAAIPQLPQVQQTQPFRSSNTQGYPNQTGYMPHGTPFQQQGPATPHIAPSRPASQSQPLGAYRQGLQQSPMPAPPSNPYQPNLSSRNPSPASFAPSVAPSHVYHKAQTGDIGPYQTQSSHQGPVHGQTAPPVTIANLPPMTATQSTDSTRYHRHVGEHPAKNDQHHAQAKAKPQQQTQPGPALNRPSAPKPTQAHSASAAPSDKQSDKTGQGHGQGQGQGTKKPKLSRRQRKKRARENAAKQMTTTHTAARAVTEGTSNSTLGEPATTAEASTDTALAPKVAAEENHPPDVEPSDGESQPMQLESSGSDNNDDKDAAVVDETMHGVGKGKAADTLVDEGTRPNLPFRLGKSQQARTSLAHQAHYQVTPQVPPDVSGLEGTSDNNTTLDEDQVLGAAAPSSTAPQVPPQVPGLESTSDNNTTLDEDQVLGAAATSSTKAVSGTSSTRAVSNGDLELDSGSIETPLPSATNQPTDGAKGTVKDNKPSPGPASHQPGAKPTLHSQKMEGATSSGDGQGNGQQKAALAEPQVNVTRKKARKRAARSAQKSQQAASAADDDNRSQSGDQGLASPGKATDEAENAAEGSRTTDDTGREASTVELQFPKLERLKVAPVADADAGGPSRDAGPNATATATTTASRTCECVLTPEGFGHWCKEGGYTWEDFAAEMEREADAASPLNWPEPPSKFPRRR